MIRWSPIRRVFSMELEGMTRAWPMVPLMSRNARATQNQAMISRVIRWRMSCESLCMLWVPFFLELAFTFQHLAAPAVRSAGDDIGQLGEVSVRFLRTGRSSAGGAFRLPAAGAVAAPGADAEMAPSVKAFFRSCSATC